MTIKATDFTFESYEIVNITSNEQAAVVSKSTYQFFPWDTIFKFLLNVSVCTLEQEEGLAQWVK
jgi:hypothetical protein